MLPTRRRRGYFRLAGAGYRAAEQGPRWGARGSHPPMEAQTRLSTMCSRGATPREGEPEADHPDAEQEVQPVVGRVHRHEVGARVEVDQEAVQPEHEVGGAPPTRNAWRAPRARQHEPGHAEEQVDEVVQDAHVEDPEQLGRAVVAGEVRARRRGSS